MPENGRVRRLGGRSLRRICPRHPQASRFQRRRRRRSTEILAAVRGLDRAFEAALVSTRPDHASVMTASRRGDEDVHGLPVPATRNEPPLARGFNRLLIQPARIARADDANRIRRTDAANDQFEEHRALNLRANGIGRVARSDRQRCAGSAAGAAESAAGRRVVNAIIRSPMTKRVNCWAATKTLARTDSVWCAGIRGAVVTIRSAGGHRRTGRLVFVFKRMGRLKSHEGRPSGETSHDHRDHPKGRAGTAFASRSHMSSGCGSGASPHPGVERAGDAGAWSRVTELVLEERLHTLAARWREIVDALHALASAVAESPPPCTCETSGHSVLPARPRRQAPADRAARCVQRARALGSELARTMDDGWRSLLARDDVQAGRLHVAHRFRDVAHAMIAVLRTADGIEGACGHLGDGRHSGAVTAFRQAVVRLEFAVDAAATEISALLRTGGCLK